MTQDRKMILDVAFLHYKRGKSASEIADMLGIHRSKVSKLLAKAKEGHMIEFILHLPLEYELAEQTRERFPILQDVIVVNVPCPPCSSDDENRTVRAQSLVEGGEKVLKKISVSMKRDSPIWVIGGGITVKEFVMGVNPDSLSLNLFKELLIVSGSMGKVDEFIDISPNIIVGLLKGKLGVKTRAYAFNVPCLLQKGDDKAKYTEQKQVKDIFSLMDRADVVVTGVGDLEPGSRMYGSLKAAGVDVDRLREQGVVGDILDQVFDLSGNADQFRDHNDRVLALPLNRLKEMADSKQQRVLCLAVGPESKAKALLGAISGRYIDSLVSDVETIRLLLSL